MTLEIPAWLVGVFAAVQLGQTLLYAIVAGTLKWQGRSVTAISQRQDAFERRLEVQNERMDVHAERLGLAPSRPVFRYNPDTEAFERLQ